MVARASRLTGVQVRHGGSSYGEPAGMRHSNFCSKISPTSCGLALPFGQLDHLPLEKFE